MVGRRAAATRRGAALNATKGAAPRPLPVTARGRRARNHIVVAAAGLMYQRGVYPTSLDDVLAAAGCGKSQLYHYFDGKADLVGAVIDRQLEVVLAAQPRLGCIDSWESFDDWLADIVHMHSAPGGPFACPLGTIAAELKNDESFRLRLDAAFGRWVAPLARGLQRMKDRGDLAAEADPERLATSVLAAMQGGMLLGRIRADITPMRDAVDAARTQIRRWSPSAVDSQRRRHADQHVQGSTKHGRTAHR